MQQPNNHFKPKKITEKSSMITEPLVGSIVPVAIHTGLEPLIYYHCSALHELQLPYGLSVPGANWRLHVPLSYNREVA